LIFRVFLKLCAKQLTWEGWTKHLRFPVDCFTANSYSGVNRPDVFAGCLSAYKSVFVAHVKKRCRRRRRVCRSCFSTVELRLPPDYRANDVDDIYTSDECVTHFFCFLFVSAAARRRARCDRRWCLIRASISNVLCRDN